jgi:hypothetical protein
VSRDRSETRGHRAIRAKPATKARQASQPRKLDDRRIGNL